MGRGGSEARIYCALRVMNIYIYIYRWVQVTPGVTLKSYTFSKPLDLSRSNGQKRHSLMVIFRRGFN